MAELNDDYISVQEGGDVRKLCARPVEEDTRPTVGHVFAETPTTRLIPRNEWQPVDLSHWLSPIKDQNGIGECNWSSTGNCMEGCRAMHGLPHYDLSAGDGYSWTNGGSDNGSLPEDALKRMLTDGVATVASVPYHNWRTKYNSPEIVAERKRFRFLEALWCPTFEHAASALQQGFFLDTAVWWYSRDPVDADGWLNDVGGGSRGGHAICGCGLVERNGRWGIKIANSWTRAWGKDGFGVLPEARCVAGTKVFRWWALREVVQESGELPVPKFG